MPKTIVHPNMRVMSHVRKKSNEKTQFERFKNLELSKKNIIELYKFSKKIKIDFAVTPFDIHFVKILSKYVKFFKIASGDIDFIPLLEEINKYRKPVILSTGLSSDKNIELALNTLQNTKVTLLHCISSYPTKTEESNLDTIKYLKNKFNVPVGLSDHTYDEISSIVAVGMGVRIIEKHFLPNSTINNVGDYELSLNPKEFKIFRNKINSAFLSLGKHRRKEFDSEKKFKKTLKRSIYFNYNFTSGHKIAIKNLSFIRPFNIKGVRIDEYKKIIGKQLKHKVKKLQLVKYSLF